MAAGEQLLKLVVQWIGKTVVVECRETDRTSIRVGIISAAYLHDVSYGASEKNPIPWASLNTSIKLSTDPEHHTYLRYNPDEGQNWTLVDNRTNHGDPIGPKIKSIPCTVSILLNGELTKV